MFMRVKLVFNIFLNYVGGNLMKGIVDMSYGNSKSKGWSIGVCRKMGLIGWYYQTRKIL